MPTAVSPVPPANPHRTFTRPTAPWLSDPERVSLDDLAVVRSPDPTSLTGYEGVYRRCEPDRTRTKYVAKAFKRPCGPPRDTPREAACDAVRWWRWHFGAGWRGFFRGRAEPAAVVVRGADGCRVLAYVRGVPEYVGGGRKARGAVFPTAAAARAAYARWVADRLGLLAPVRHLYLRRAAVPRPGG